MGADPAYANATPATPVAEESMCWGAEPDLVGPRHYYRVALMARLLSTHLPPGAHTQTSTIAADAPVRVLDAGSGRGTLALLLASEGYSVTALDASAACAAYLSGQLQASPFGTGARDARWFEPRSVQASVEALPFTSASFDAAVCGEVLEHVRDDFAAVDELARVVRPGGVLVVSAPGRRAYYGWIDRWAGHARRYELGELRMLIGGHGFKVIEARHWGFPFGLLYERLVQRPVLARHARRRGLTTLAQRVGRAALTARAAGALFRADHLCDRVPWGPGLLLVARRDD